MSPENFVYWLKGYFALTTAEGLNQDQIRLLRQYLDEVSGIPNNSLPSGINAQLQQAVNTMNQEDITDNTTYSITPYPSGTTTYRYGR